MLDDSRQWISATPKDGVSFFPYDNYKNRRGAIGTEGMSVLLMQQRHWLQPGPI